MKFRKGGKYMRMPFQRKTSHSSCRKPKNGGYSLPEVMIGSVILASAVTMTAELSNSTVNGMQRMDQRAKLDSAIAARMEEIRETAFRLHCTQGCINEQLTKQLKYNLTTLKPLCETTELGQSLLTQLTADNLASDFNLTQYNPTAQSTPITTTLTASGNQVNVTLSESSTGLSVTTSVVPHAQGWCR